MAHQDAQQLHDGCTVTRRIVIEDKNLQKNQPWVPVVETIGELEFMKICKWDRKLAMFVMAVGMDLRKRGDSSGHKRSLNVQFLEQLQTLRTCSCDAVVADIYAADDAMQEGRHKSKKARKAKASDRCIAPRYVAVECPPISRGTIQLAGRSINMLFDIKNQPVWVEATSDNLDYIRQGILSSMEARELGTHWRQLHKNAEVIDDASGDVVVAVSVPESDDKAVDKKACDDKAVASSCSAEKDSSSDSDSSDDS
jgi:hypothetical protein